MRWERRKPPDWERWFAWHPVFVDTDWSGNDIPGGIGYYVWGEWVERKRLAYIDGVSWCYRPRKVPEMF